MLENIILMAPILVFAGYCIYKMAPDAWSYIRNPKANELSFHDEKEPNNVNRHQ